MRKHAALLDIWTENRTGGRAEEHSLPPPREAATKKTVHWGRALARRVIAPVRMLDSSCGNAAVATIGDRNQRFGDKIVF